MKVDFQAPWPTGEPPAPAMCGEDARASVLEAYGLDALEDDGELAQITAFAARLCGAPIAMVSIVERERQMFLTRAGLEERETPRPTSFCAHAMLEPEPLVVADAKEDPRFETNPLVTGHPNIRFYAGAPLISHEGAPIGSLCVIDTVPRPEGLTDLQIDGLQTLAQSVMRRLRYRRENLENLREVRRSEERLRSIIDSVPGVAWSADANGTFDYFNARWRETTGADEPATTQEWAAFIHPDDNDATQERFRQAVENGDPFEDEWRLKQADGTWRWVLSRAIPTELGKSRTRWFGTLTDIDEQHRRSEERELLSQELAHRIKNIFAVFSGLVSLRTRGKPELQDFAAELSEAVRALGRAQDFVRPLTDKKGDELVGLIEVLLAPYRGGGTVTVEGDPVPIGQRSATPLALTFHELATNAAKYGALACTDGALAVSVERDGDCVVVRWREQCPQAPDPVDLESGGFGSRLLRMTVEGQLEGSMEHDWREEGLAVTLRIPAESLVR